MTRARYIIRFDDICPTMNWRVWLQIVKVLHEYGIKPLLAIVPDNRDPKLQIDSPNPDFWNHVRQWQTWGCTIALHGYQHLYVTRNRGLVGRRALSEFAGLPECEQREKLTRGLSLLRTEGIVPTVWVAPGHTFDAVTVGLLAEVGITRISDGFWRWPRREPNGIFWIPQQLWALRPAPAGVWTACYHVNRWREEDLLRFETDIERWHARISSVPEVETAWGYRKGARWERAFCLSRFAYWNYRVRLGFQSHWSRWYKLSERKRRGPENGNSGTSTGE